MTGIVLTIIVHLAICLLCVFSGLKYIYPPPRETSFVINFEEPEEPQIIKRTLNGREPESEIIDKNKRINLVKESEALHIGKKPNLGKAATVDDFGDVDVEKPEEEPKIDNRALFHTADNKSDKDTLAAQTARKISDALKAGHPLGNTKTGKTDGTPNAHLKGRNVMGTLPRPVYAIQQDGIVVVTIWVDQYGKVQKALPGAEGTTVTDKILWAAARKAALGAHFNMSADAPPLQQGTIKYIFNLK